MKYFLIIVILTFCLNTLLAQEKHFIFIQAENGQPFYVLVNGKLYSSTSGGYVIIPKLVDGEYSCSIGFAQNAYPEQTFQFSISKKDLGFNLKNFGASGWGLFNLQSLSVTMAGASTSADVAKAVKDAAQDGTESIISFNKKKKEPEMSSVQAKDPADTVSSQLSQPNQKPTFPEAKSENLGATSKNTTNANTISDVRKVSEVKADEGTTLSYTDQNGKVTDTVQVIIPAGKDKTQPGSNIAASVNKNLANQGTTVSPPVINATSKSKDEFKFLDVDMNETLTKGSKQTNAGIKTISNCENIATEDDYARLRKKMSTETSDEEMINEAKKVYRKKCFTTSQIRGLSTLFMSDEGRFKFFNASSASVIDAPQFFTLQSEFVDPAFVNRFKAMLQ